MTACSCICWLFHRIYYDARNHKHKKLSHIQLVWQTRLLFSQYLYAENVIDCISSTGLRNVTLAPVYHWALPHEFVRCSLFIELGLILFREICACHILIFRHTRIIYAFYNLFISLVQLPCCLSNGHTNTHTISICVDVEDTNAVFALWAGIAQSV